MRDYQESVANGHTDTQIADHTDAGQSDRDYQESVTTGQTDTQTDRARTK